MKNPAGGTSLVPVILAGGDGTRLWPLSRNGSPKPFLKLFGDRTLIQQTIDRICSPHSGLDISRLVVVTAERNERLVRQQLNSIAGVRLDVILEPCGRNTAPAVAAASAYLLKQCPNSTALVTPVDHFIAEPQKFHNAVAQAHQAADDKHVVTFGVRPDRPETGYGYIEYENHPNLIKSVKRFKEKPSINTARRYLRSNNHLWNSGIIVFQPQAIQRVFGDHAPETWEASVEAVRLGEYRGNFLRLHEKSFSSCRDAPIDRAIMEKCRNLQVIEVDMGWSDIGAWDQVRVLEESTRNASNLIQIDSDRIFANTGKKRVTTIGLSDLVIVDTPDDLLIAKSGQSHHVGEIAAKFNQTDNHSGVSFKSSSRLKGAESWLENSAIPLWCDNGRDLVSGGVVEHLSDQGDPVQGEDKRLRVLARQIYAVSHAMVAGITTDQSTFLEGCLETLITSGWREEGGWVHKFPGPFGTSDSSPESCDHAFVLLGLSWMYRATENPKCLEWINKTQDYLDCRLLPIGGGNPVKKAGKAFEFNTVAMQFGEAPPQKFVHLKKGLLPIDGYCTTPDTLMHLLEAFMAVFEATRDQDYLKRAGEIVDQFERNIFNAESWAVIEPQNACISSGPHPQSSIVPGHHYEWISLLLIYGRLSGRNLIKPARKLFAFAQAFGFNENTGLVVDELAPSGGIRIFSSRCWAQCELIKALIALRESGEENLDRRLEQAVDRLFEYYLDPVMPGLWHDKIDAEGNPVRGNVPASTLYHLTGALIDYTSRQPGFSDARCRNASTTD